MQIALIEAGVPRNGLTTTCVNYSEPIGLCYIGAVLRKAGFEVKIFQQINESNQELINQVEKYNPQIIGFSSMTYNFMNTLVLAKEFKKLNPNIKIVIGGIHVTNNQDCMRYNFIDSIVMGEGENTFFELVNYFMNNGDFTKIQAVASYDDKKIGKIIITEPRERIKNLDSLPFPLRDGLRIGESCYARLSPSYPSREMGQRRASIQTARGCLGNCAFCNSPGSWRRQWIGRSAKNVVDEIEFLITDYQINYLEIRDENFAFNREHAMNICKELITRGLNQKIHWYAQCRVDGLMINNRVDRELLQTFKEAGMFEIELGIESGNQQILNSISKGITLKQVREVVNACHKIGLAIHGLFILGLPGENEKTINKTLYFMKALNFDRIRISFSTPFEGTRLFADLSDNDKQIIRQIPYEQMTTDYPVLPLRDKKDRIIYTQEELIKTRSWMYREFYAREDWIKFLAKKWKKNQQDLSEIMTALRDWLQTVSQQHELKVIMAIKSKNIYLDNKLIARLT